jgi:hypothetical protein
MIEAPERRKILETIGLSSKKFPSINRRVEKLGKLNDRRLKARSTRDRQALLEVAADYVDIGCPRLANEIMAEAEGL